MPRQEHIAVGIDLGTSNSCVAIFRDGRPEILADPHGSKVHSSVVAFRPNNTMVVGNAAKALLTSDPANTVYSAKRLMGRYFFSDEVRKAKTRLTYALEKGPNNSVHLIAQGRTMTPQDVGACVLQRMKQVAENATGLTVKEAVITVPAYFNDNQRQATRDAGRIAGLEILRIINEPTAAALAYGYGKDLTQRVAVYDLGGGTFDVSILEIGGDIYEVLSTAGDTYLGGDDIDEVIVKNLLDHFYSATGIDLRGQAGAMATVQEAAETAKKALSRDESFDITLLQLGIDDAGKPQDLQYTLTRQELARMSMGIIQKTFKVCDEAMQSANVIPSELDGVILVGGPTRLPFIRDAVGHYFQTTPKSDVNPDEVVALGAAIQAHTLTQPSAAATLLDVTSLALRLGTVSGYTEEIIERNTPIPIEKTRSFTTVADDQDCVQIRVLQGEERLQEDCELLGEFEFSGLPKRARGQVRIDVTFEIDASGIVHVHACEAESGIAASTTIHLSSGLSEADIVAKRQAQTQATTVGSVP